MSPLSHYWLGNESRSIGPESLLKLAAHRRAIAYVVRLNGEDLNSKIHLKTTNTFSLKAGLFVNAKISTKVD